MKKYIFSLALLVSMASLADTTNTMVEVKPKEDVNAIHEKVDAAKELGMAVYWYQTSGEAKALYQQGFNSAKNYFDSVKVKKNKKKAIVVDLDETMMNNSEHAAYQFAYGKSFDPVVWTKWVNAKRATATQGAVEYNNYVNTHGGTVFYVSNRNAKTELDATIENLKDLGFKGATKDRMMFKTTSSKKEERYREIEKMGYEIVQYIGDNLNDFTDATYKGDISVRNKWVDEHLAEFGTKYIILPNPLYGGFESRTLKDRHEALKLTDWYK